MKIWFNKVNESRRNVVEVPESEVTVGRDPGNGVVLSSPLVSRRHAVVRISDGKLHLENVGLNSCLVGDEEVLGGQTAVFDIGTKVRIWPFTLTFEAEKAASISRAELEAHLRSIMADLELRIHRKLLERLDLYEFETNRVNDVQSIMVLENNIEDVCREMRLFGAENEPLLDEITGLTLRDHLVNQLILETGVEEYFDLAALTSNEFDVPATLVPEREAELHGLLQFVRQRLNLGQCHDVSDQIHRVEGHFADNFHLIRPHLHRELRKYLILRTLKKDLKDTIFGFGPLQDLLRAPTVTEIMVVGQDQIYVERDGVIEKSGRRFISDKVTEAIIERIVAQVGRRIDKSQPLVDARLPDGSRVNAIIPPLAVKGPCLTVRKFPIQRLTMDDLIEMGSMTRAAAQFLRSAVIDHRNILVSGGTGTGKTTMLNVLSAFIPYKERVVTIEDTTELRLHQEHVVTLETKPPNIEGAGEYTIRDLVKNSLRMRPDRIIVGECRGSEALDMIQAMNTGHAGSMTTVHANSAQEVIERLEVLMLMAADLPVASIHRQIASAIDLVLHISRQPGGRRVVTQISEVVRYDPEMKQIVMNDIFNFRDGLLLRPTGYLPSFVDSLIDKQLLELEFLYGEPAAEDGKALPAPAPARIELPGCEGQAMMPGDLTLAAIACVLLGTGAAGAVYFGRPYVAWGVDLLERDLSDKLRRLRVDTSRLRRYLKIWLWVIVVEFLVFWLVLDSFIFGLLTSAFLLSGPWYMLRRMAARHRQRIEDQLADAMVTMANAVKAGLSLAQAMEILAAQCPKPINAEFYQIAAEYKLGKPLERTLREAKERLQSENFALFAAALLASHESGGRLNETIERIAQSVLELQRLERKVMSETAQARKSAVYMAMVPFLILVVYFFIDQDNTTLLFTERFGQMVLALVVVLNVLAYLSARKILNPEI